SRVLLLLLLLGIARHPLADLTFYVYNPRGPHRHPVSYPRANVFIPDVTTVVQQFGQLRYELGPPWRHRHDSSMLSPTRIYRIRFTWCHSEDTGELNHPTMLRILRQNTCTNSQKFP